MADMEVQVVARAVGFEKLALDVERATAAIKQMGAATRGSNVSGGAAAKQLSEDMARVTNGLTLGQKLGTQMRHGMAQALGNQSFWSSTFNGIAGRFSTFGKTIGRSMAVGIQAGVANIRGMNGGAGLSHSDLFGAAFLGGLAFKGVEDLTKAAADRQGALFRLASTGLTTAPQRVALSGLAEDWSNKFGNISTTEGLDFLKDSLQIFGGTQELFTDGGKGAMISPEGRAAMTRIAGLLSYSKTYQAASGHDGNPEAVMAQFAAAIRSGEIKGLGSNPTDLANWVEKLTKIQLATGVDPATFLSAQRKAGLSFLTMNDDAILKFATMVQEQKTRAGVMAATSFMHMVGGGSQRGRSNEMMRSLGFFGDDANVQRLADEGKLELSPKTGKITHIVDTSIIPNDNDFAKDPYKWYANTLYPAVRAKIMKDSGVDIGDRKQAPSQRTLDNIVSIMRNLGATFPSRNEANQAAESIIQAPQIERRAELARKAAIDEQAANDLIVKQTMDFSAQMNNLKVNLGQTILPSVTDLLKTFTGWIKEFGDFSKAHPELSGNILKYGLGGLIAGGLFAGLGIIAKFANLPFQILKSIVIASGTTLFGTGLATADLFAGAGGVSLAAMGQTSAKVKAWIGATGMIRGVLGDVVKLMGLLSRIFTAYEIGNWAFHTDTGQKMWEAFKKELDARFNSGNSHGKQHLAEEAHWLSNKTARANVPGLAWLTPAMGAPPSYLHALFGDRAKYMDFLHRDKNSGLRDWLKHIQPITQPVPASFYMGWAPVNRNSPNMGGQNHGPVPVVVTQMPKNEKPTTVNINVGPLNVQTGASFQSVGGTVGSVVQSKLRNALGDTHH